MSEQLALEFGPDFENLSFNGTPLQEFGVHGQLSHVTVIIPTLNERQSLPLVLGDFPR